MLKNYNNCIEELEEICINFENNFELILPFIDKIILDLNFPLLVFYIILKF